MTSSRHTNRPLSRCATSILLTVLICLFFTFMLGNRPLSVPDEGRYVEIPREMVATGDYLTPRLNGVKYFEKPVLFYWLEGLFDQALRPEGIHAPPLAGAVRALRLSCRCRCRRAAVRTHGPACSRAAVLATSLLYYGLSRAIILDMPVSVLAHRCAPLLSPRARTKRRG